MTQKEIVSEKIDLINQNIDLVQQAIADTIDLLTVSHSHSLMRRKQALEDELENLQQSLKDEYELQESFNESKQNDFESSLSKLNLINNGTPEQFKKLEETIKRNSIL